MGFAGLLCFFVGGFISNRFILESCFLIAVIGSCRIYSVPFLTRSTLGKTLTGVMCPVG